MTLRDYQKQNIKRDLVVVKFAKKGLSAQAISKELEKLGYENVSRQRIWQIIKRNKNGKNNT